MDRSFYPCLYNCLFHSLKATHTAVTPITTWPPALPRSFYSHIWDHCPLIETHRPEAIHYYQRLGTFMSNIATLWGQPSHSLDNVEIDSLPFVLKDTQKGFTPSKGIMWHEYATDSSHPSGVGTIWSFYSVTHICSTNSHHCTYALDGHGGGGGVLLHDLLFRCIRTSMPKSVTTTSVQYVSVCFLPGHVFKAVI